MPFIRKAYIPCDAIEVIDPASDAIAYAYDAAKTGKPCALVFYGKQSKPISHCIYRDDDRRAAAVAELFDSRAAHLAYVAAARKSPSGTATRNRAIKAVLERAYGKGLVRVTGSRGTGYGWVRVAIAIPSPLAQAWHDERSRIVRLIIDAGIDLGSYDSADYGAGYKLSIDFTG